MKQRAQKQTSPESQCDHHWCHEPRLVAIKRDARLVRPESRVLGRRLFIVSYGSSSFGEPPMRLIEKEGTPKCGTAGTCADGNVRPGRDVN